MTTNTTKAGKVATSLLVLDRSKKVMRVCKKKLKEKTMKCRAPWPEICNCTPLGNPVRWPTVDGLRSCVYFVQVLERENEIPESPSRGAILSPAEHLELQPDHFQVLLVALQARLRVVDIHLVVVQPVLQRRGLGL